jgi:branched-chain amino acid transport system ATP-binding protein
MPEPALLCVEGLQAWYGESHVLHGVSFDVRVGEVVTLLGRNGAGKTTTLKSIMGIVGRRTGSVRFEGRELVGCASNEIARAGIALCPEERGIFASLSVEENLMLPPVVKAGGLGLDRIFTLFPNLKERLSSSQGTKLSGGEQQMLAIARALATDPSLLLLDELSMGLAPIVVEKLYEIVAQIATTGVSILIVEQFARAVLAIADSAGIMLHGRMAAFGTPAEIGGALSAAYLGA